MTFTSDERREVAENLRNLTIGRSIQYKEQFFDELAEVVVGFEDYHGFNVVLEKLADLIDRSTCDVRMGVTGHVGVCTRCGAMVEMRAAVFDAIEALPTRYCPNCGAEVNDGVD